MFQSNRIVTKEPTYIGTLYVGTYQPINESQS